MITRTQTTHRVRHTSPARRRFLQGLKGLVLAAALATGCQSKDSEPAPAERAAQGEANAESDERSEGAVSYALDEAAEYEEAPSSPAPTGAATPARQRKLAMTPPTDGVVDAGPVTSEHHAPNPWTLAAEDRLSTFAADVDTASFTIARRMLMEGRLPSASTIRPEEFVNYFRYADEAPAASSQMPFSVTMEGAPSPWTEGAELVRIGIAGKAIPATERPPVHLTFLVDVSGSMTSADKLGLAKRSLRMLVDQLHEGDTVSLVTYAGNTRVVLEPTGLEHRAQIHAALEDLTAGGSTAMQSGLELAYAQAHKALKDSEPGAVNRVIVLSDGDANVGATSHQEILASIGQYVDEGITLSTIGVGMGNYRDTTMEQLANEGNGNNYYFDSLDQAKRVFVEQLGGTLQVIAKDVKIQVDFDPAQVSEYRLVGYENRDIADADFRDDAVDAGEIGAGHHVTALYEVKRNPDVDPEVMELATVRVRHKHPEGDHASEHEWTLGKAAFSPSLAAASDDLRFAAAVATFAELLRESGHAGDADWSMVAELARGAIANDSDRQAFLEMVEAAEALAPNRDATTAALAE